MKKPTIIIIEGSNNSGKTTLANRIWDQLDFHYIKCNQPKNGDAYSEYMSILEDIENNPRNVIIDRFHLGSDVYGPLYRGKTDLNCVQFEDVENKLLSMNFNVVPIIAYTDIDFIREAHVKNEEEYLNIDDIKLEIELFKSAISKSIFKWKHHDIVNNDITNSLIDYIEDNNE